MSPGQLWWQPSSVKNTNSHRNFRENVCSIVVITVPADGLAPLGARPSPGTVMTKYESCIYWWLYILWHWSKMTFIPANLPLKLQLRLWYLVSIWFCSKHVNFYIQCKPEKSFWVKSWNNGMRCMSFYIATDLLTGVKVIEHVVEIIV